MTTCNASQLALTNSATSTNTFPLNNADCVDSAVLPSGVDVLLTEQQVDDLQNDPSLATSVGNTYLVMTDFIEDENGTFNQLILPGMALQATNFVPLVESE